MKNTQPKKKWLYHHKKTLKELLNPDYIILFTMTKSRRQFITRTAILFTKIGNGQLWIFFALSMFIYNVPTALAFIYAIIFQLYIQSFLKNIIKRARPYLIYQDLEYLYKPPDPYSFPSGHTCAAFTMVFVSKVVLTAAVWPFFLFIALIIAFSRVYLAVHYPSDVFAGVIIAYFVAKLGIWLSMLSTGTNLWI